MAAYFVLVVQSSLDTIQTLNDKLQRPTKANDAINACIDVLGAIAGGATNAQVQITTRDSDPGVATSGTGSEQFTYNKL